LKNASIFYHFGVEVVQMLVWNYTFDHHQSILIDTAHSIFEVPVTKSFALDFFGRGTDNLWQTL
jgi:hypothetical protein